MSDSPIRIECPGCHTRLSIPSQTVSPYIRCGVCRALIECRTDNASSADAIVADELATGSRNDASVSYDRDKPAANSTDPMPYGPGPTSDLEAQEVLQVLGGNTSQQSSGFSALATITFVVGLLLFLGYLNTQSIPKKSTASTFRVDPDVDLQDYLKDYRNATKRATDLPAVEINLNGSANSNFSVNTTKVTVEGRNWTSSEIASLLRLRRLTKLGYTNVQVNAEDLPILRSRQLTELNLSRSKWKRGQMLFNGEYYPDLQKLDLSFTGVGGFEISGLKDCKQLIDLNLRGTTVSDGDLSSISRHRTLENLDLRNTKVTYSGLIRLRFPQLKFLKLSDEVLTTSQHETLRKQFKGTTILVVSNVDLEP